MNAGEIIKQWTNVHAVSSDPTSSDTVDGYPHRAWTDASGETVVEEYVITGMAHGTPLAVGNDENSYGAAGPFPARRRDLVELSHRAVLGTDGILRRRRAKASRRKARFAEGV